MIARIVEHFANHTRRLANIFVDNGRRHNLEEVAVELRGDGASEESFARARWTVKKTEIF